MNESKFFRDSEAPLVLIVDDIPKNLQLLSNILNIDGYQISFASSGEQALAIAKKSQPDLILLDIMMPDMDGFEVCRRLKQSNATRNSAVIFLTGRVEPEDIIEGFKLGAVDYVTKPFNAVELLSRVRSHIELKLSRDKIMKQNEQLVKYQEELQQAIASKDKFFSIISHDLRGPFSGFIGLSDLLANEYDELSTTEISQIAKNMNVAANRLFAFLENLLEWSKAQMGRIEYEPHRIMLHDTIDSNIELISDTAREKNISIRNEIGKNDSVYADSDMLNTMLRNLLSNAVKYSNKNGEIVLSSLPAKSDFYKLCVSDNGVGMNQETLKKIFRIDSKFTNPGTNNEKGSGLGLILVKELAEKSGGSVEVKSMLGEGSQFSITLPMSSHQINSVKR